jgi:hypothetical protein
MTTFALHAKGFRGNIETALVTLAVSRGLEKVEDDHEATVWFDIDVGEDVVIVVYGVRATATLAEHIASALANGRTKVLLVSVHIPSGKRGAETTASGACYEGGLVFVDERVQAVAEEVIADWRQEGPIYEETEVEIDLARELLELEGRGRDTIELRFKVKPAARLTPVFDAIAAKDPVELLTVAGRPAVKLRFSDGSSRTMVLDDKELVAVTAALKPSR